MEWRGESHARILDLLRRAGIVGKIDYHQSCHVSPHQDMTVGRYTWHDGQDDKRMLFVLESLGS